MLGGQAVVQKMKVAADTSIAIYHAKVTSQRKQKQFIKNPSTEMLAGNDTFGTFGHPEMSAEVVTRAPSKTQQCCLLLDA